MTLDLEEELRAGLIAFDPGAETVSRHVEEDGGTTIVVEVLRDGVPAAGNERQTGHGAVATILEERLGIRTPYRSLEERALSHGRPERDEWIEAVTALWRRGDEETFQAAAAGCASGEPLRQAFAVDVLGRLGFTAKTRGQVVQPFAARALPLLRELSREATDPELLQAAVLGLGHHGDPAALPEILRHAGHPDAGVRHRVALALCGLVPGDHTEGVRTLIALTRDSEPAVRDWATTALAGVDADTPEIREALAARVSDHDAETVAEAARGLAMRQDPRAEQVLARLLADEDPEGYAHDTAANAVRHLRDERLRRRLDGTLPRRP
ncbi:HEAT repeat domain-containing protein [Streptomyces peucetius]|uniref:HEAT repeat domain-containing protein n=1 Tax=Streptomyces peucetius TaxID=1950 RepID=A0ABY6I3K3_STRPE|nr:HEAT repeat domain-containing protein [Streptomyces peucetius]UYQ61557.1 HEAT repeat domain-containing protein [Streptomyces peucetius]